MISAILISSLIAGDSPSLSLRVDGEGFFRFGRGATLVYARHVKLVVQDGYLSSTDGAFVLPKIAVPATIKSLKSSIDGTITGIHEKGEKELGSLVLAMFSTPPTFKPNGVLSFTSAKSTICAPGEGFAGVIRPIQQVATKPTSPFQPTNSQTKAQKFTEPASTETKVQVKVFPISSVDQDFFNLQAVAEISGDSDLVEKLKTVEIGRSPVLGTKKSLSVMLIKALISSSGIDTRKVDLVVPNGASVERKSQKVLASEIKDAMLQSIQKHLNLNINAEPRQRMIDVMVPPGVVKLEASAPQINTSDMSVTVDVLIDDKLITTVYAKYDLSALPQVKRDAPVRLRIVSKMARIEVDAKTKGSAFVGQNVVVETANGTVHTGKLISNSLVEVTL